MSAALASFQLLEVNLISAQDLAKVARSMRTYAAAWVHPERKLTTRVDPNGVINPTWNDKFVFRVDDSFLRSDTSAIMIEIYAVHWLRDIHVGTVRVLVSNLVPSFHRSATSQSLNHLGMRFVALQVRRPSGRPQGILNLGITVLDSTMRSMPLYTQLSTSAVGYERLMGQRSGIGSTGKQSGPQLRHTKSNRSSIITARDDDKEILHKPTSTVNCGSELGPATRSNKGKIIYDKPLSIIDGGSEIGGKFEKKMIKNNSKERSIKKSFINESIWSESEVGPSPSEVEAAIAEDRKFREAAEGWSSVLDDGSEGLKMKLERWRMELPTAYDCSSTLTVETMASMARHVRRRTMDDVGKFSCFGNICGYECSIACGRDDMGSASAKKGQRRRVPRTLSMDTTSTYL